MSRFMPEEPEPVKAVWLVNPDGRVIDVPEDQPFVGFARAGIHMWKMASKEQIAEAIAENEAENAKALARKAKVKTGADVAKAAVIAAHELVTDGGGPSGSPDPEPAKPKKGGRKKK